jgi:hypothetical protein
MTMTPENSPEERSTCNQTVSNKSKVKKQAAQVHRRTITKKSTGGQKQKKVHKRTSTKSPQADQEDVTNPHPPLGRKYAYPHMGFSMGQHGFKRSREMMEKLKRRCSIWVAFRSKQTSIPSR